MTDNKLIDENGIRKDGRKADTLRPISMQVGVLKRADGSSYVEWGKNKILVGVYGPKELHPRYKQDATKAQVRCYYRMASFSVSDRKRPGPSRRAQEISKIVSEALESVVIAENFPRTVIDVFIEILEADAGTRCAGLTAASLALADAGIPMRCLVPSCAVGKIDGQIVVDLMKEEDNIGDADLPLAIHPKTDDIVLMQMDGNMTQEELLRALEMGVKACHQVHDLQREALRSSYTDADMDDFEEVVMDDQ